MTLVLIDDCPMTMAILKAVAGSRGERHVVGITNPIEGWSYLRGNPANCIVLDYSMPELDGIKLASLLRETALHAKTPIVMLTATEDAEVERRALEAGVNEFLRKPVRLGLFKTLLAKILPAGGWPIIDRRNNSGGAPPAEGERRRMAE